MKVLSSNEFNKKAFITLSIFLLEVDPLIWFCFGGDHDTGKCTVFSQAALADKLHPQF